MKAKIYVANVILEHKRIQAKINIQAKTRMKRVRVINTFPYNLNEKCQKDLGILADYTERSKTPEYFDHAKDIVFKTLGYCVGENL